MLQSLLTVSANAYSNTGVEQSLMQEWFLSIINVMEECAQLQKWASGFSLKQNFLLQINDLGLRSIDGLGTLFRDM